MSQTESALSSLRQVVATFAPSTASSRLMLEQLVQVVAEAFMSGTRLSDTEPRTALRGSAEERQLAAVDLVDTLLLRTDDVPALCETLQSAQMHPTVALFVQELLAMSVSATDTQACYGSSRSAKVHAVQVLRHLVRRVGVDTCRRLLPGVVSQSVKFMVGCLSRCGAPQPTKLLVAVCDVLREILRESFLAAGTSMRTNSTLQNEIHSSNGSVPQQSSDKWTANAVAKLGPLLGTVLDATLLSNVLPHLSLTLIESLKTLSHTHREILVSSPPSCASDEHEAAIQRLIGLECFLEDVQHKSPGRGWDATSQKQLLAEFSRYALTGGPLRVFHLSLFKCALELVLPSTTPTRWSGCGVAVSTQITGAAEELVLGSEDGLVEAEEESASFLWSVVRRAIRLVATHADGEQWMTRTPQESLEKESSYAQRQALPKTCEHLLNELLLVIGRVARVRRGNTSSCSQLAVLQERTLLLLDDWSRYELHPAALYVYSRLHLFGQLGHPTMAVADASAQSGLGNAALLSHFVRQGEFESLWERVLCRPHLWRIEEKISECTLQQQQHRALVARVILCALRVLVEALGAHMVIASGCSPSPPSPRRPDGPSQRVAKRVTLLILYDLLEKGSSSLPGVREAADETLRAVVRHLHRWRGDGSGGDARNSGDDATRFFAAHGQFVVDEASRAVQDDELYPSAVNVLCGFCRFLENHLTGDKTQHGEPQRQQPEPEGVREERSSSATAPLLLAVLDVAQESWRSSSVGVVGASRRAHGMLQVMTTVAAAGRRLVERCPPSLRCYPSEDDWDDERKWTVTDADLALLQQKLYEALDFVFGKCNAARSPEIVQGVSFCTKVLSHFLQPGGRVVVHTHLNTVHRCHIAMTKWLTGPWSATRDEAVALLPYAMLCDVACGRRDGTHTSAVDATAAADAIPFGSKRTKRSTLMAKGRWLAAADIPVETAAVIHNGLTSLIELAPGFLCARMVEETAPLVLVWYVRAVWLSSSSALQSRREAATRSACVEFLRALRTLCATHLSTAAQQELTKRCRGIVRPSDCEELYLDDNNNDAAQ